MSELKSASRAGSKANLNESELPLLESVEKDIMEMKEKASLGGSEPEKDDSSPEKEGEAKKDEETKAEKKSKKPRRERAQRERSVVENLTVGLNVIDRDDKHINETVNINFEDVIAEPDAAQGIEAIWRGVFLIFTGVRFWAYRLLALFLAIPIAFVWAIVFTLITFVYIWVATPFLKVFDILLNIIRRVWTGLVMTVCEPFALAFASVFSGIRIKHQSKPDSEV
ncbi:caveolin-1-like [Artemia franciscana]|uniref:Caveolin n=1 Tax=Artemia franciscana TaxID=6661 RepID=A0AA88I333_ARTSF|nr:hypothetical protein QYM36_006113 [Artemia franciscana]KAK2718987.1 hypothetical protein QYM36_006113 [Artemia franciscana]